MYKVLYFIFVLCLCSCGDKKVTNTVEQTPKFLKSPPKFEADSAYRFIAEQVAFGPRVPGTQAHTQTANHLIKTLKRYTSAIHIQTFQASTFDNILLEGTNIIASFKPELNKRLLLNAHWDSRPFADQDKTDVKNPIDGANDGASGVGLLLEVARLLAVHDSFKIGIDIVLFDLEDYGTPTFHHNKDYSKTYFCLGSQHWIKNPHIPNYKAAYSILVDMVAFKNSIFLQESIGIQYASKLLNQIWGLAQRLNYKRFRTQTDRIPSIIHDHYFINQIGIPSIAVMGNNPDPSQTFIDVWHKHTDNLTNIDKETLKQVGDLLLTFIYNET